LTKTKSRSPASISGGSVFAGGKKVTESLILEGPGDEEFFAALAGDLGDIVSLATNLKSGMDIIQVVSAWVQNVETDGDISQLIEAIKNVPEGELDFGELTNGLVKELLIPYIKGVVSDLPESLSKMGIPDDIVKKSSEMASEAIAKI
jgi:hypothetical protein